MSNFFTDNPDLMFTLKNLDMEEIVALRENDYKQAEQFDYAPENYEDAMDNYKCSSEPNSQMVSAMS